MSEFTVKGLDGEDVVLLVRKPTAKQIREGQTVYNKTYADALQNGALFKKKLEDYLIQQGVWNEEKQKKLEDLNQSLMDSETKLNTGGIKLSEAKNVAIAMWQTRSKIRELMSERMEADALTAEGQAENMRFNYLVSVCTVYSDNGNPYFKGLDHYIENATSLVAFESASRLAAIVHNLDPNFEANLPENKFLKEFGFVDDKLRLINKEGKLVDLDGRLINEEGRFIDSDGNFIDRDGKRVDKDGSPIIEKKPFLDEDGNPMT